MNPGKNKVIQDKLRINPKNKDIQTEIQNREHWDQDHRGEHRNNEQRN